MSRVSLMSISWVSELGKGIIKVQKVLYSYVCCMKDVILLPIVTRCAILLSVNKEWTFIEDTKSKWLGPTTLLGRIDDRPVSFNLKGLVLPPEDLRTSKRQEFYHHGTIFPLRSVQ